nr:structural protein [Tolivirales sp.]
MILSKKQIEDQVLAKARKDLKKELKTKMALPNIVGGLPRQFKLDPALSKLKGLGGVERLLNPPVQSQVLLTKKAEPIVQYSQSKGRTTCRIKHREFIQDIGGVASTAFNVWFAPRVNPGSGSLFPWLADIADRFEKYRFNSLALQYRSLVGTSSSGKVTLSFDLDALDSAPKTKLEQSMCKNLVEGPVWSNFQLDINKRDLDNEPAERYVAAAVNASLTVPGTDQKTYDIGRLFMSTSGVGNTPLISGELWVEYDVELITPTNPPASGNAVGGTCAGAVTFNTINQNFSQNGNIYFTPIVGTSNFRCGVSGEYKVMLVQTGSGMLSNNALSILTAFSTDTALTADTNMNSFLSTRVACGANIRAREGDLFQVVPTPGGAPTAYVLYMFEFPFS